MFVHFACLKKLMFVDSHKLLRLVVAIVVS